MPRKAAAFMLACALVSTSTSTANSNTDTPPRIASSSLCGDGYLLALAPERAAALSWQSRHALSRASDDMKILPQIWDDIEKLTSTQAGIILLGPGEGGAAQPYLDKAGIKTHSLVWGETFASVDANIRSIGEAIRASDRAAELTADLSKRLEALVSRAERREAKPTLLYLSRSGGTAGSGTYIDAAIAAAGGTNIIKMPGWQTLDPEALVTLSPDVIITSFFEGGYESVQAKSIRHAVLVDFIKSRSVIDIPGSLWPCAGPDLIKAAELMADGLDGLE